MSTKIDQTQLQQFLKLSAYLTDFTEFQLRGTGQSELYFSTAAGIVGDGTIGELLEAFCIIEVEAHGDLALLEKRVRGAILSDEKLGPVARNLIKLWYIGTWYQLPGSWREQFGVAAEDKTFIPSPSSYIEGLLWPAIGAHPPGAKAPGYGTWSTPPEIPKSPTH